MPNIVVVGAGVSGLTSALLLSNSKANRVTVVAKHMPGDYDLEYASPWAGANFMPMATAEHSRWERRTWPELERLTREVPEAGIHFQKGRVYRRDKDLQGSSAAAMAQSLFADDPWYRELLPDFRVLGKDELIEGHEYGCEFSSICINTAIYLPWLLGQCRKNGVAFKRAVLSHISEAKQMSHAHDDNNDAAPQQADIIINATALGSIKLGGVMDDTLTPARAQTVIVRNESTPMMGTSGSDDGPAELCYLMQRAAGGGTVLGGTYDLGNWSPDPDPGIAARIMERIVRARPEIADGKGVKGLSVVRHAVGLRPCRRDGVRIEKERLGDGTWVVHNYGHAGWGYQGSYGCAERVVELVNAIRAEMGEVLDDEPKPRLFAWSKL